MFGSIFDTLKNLGEAVSKSVSHAGEVALNPQPLPPRELDGLFDPLETVALNPQPLPPQEASGFAPWSVGMGEAATLPHPLPVQEEGGDTIWPSLGDDEIVEPELDASQDELELPDMEQDFELPGSDTFPVMPPAVEDTGLAASVPTYDPTIHYAL